jgi:hypothetical protein
MTDIGPDWPIFSLAVLFVSAFAAAFLSSHEENPFA